MKEALGDGLRELNAVCPYFTMFPLDFPMAVLRELGASRKVGVVADPFCGRGTTNLAALAFGLNTIAVDAAPVAAAITKGKLAAPSVSADAVVFEARQLLSVFKRTDVPQGRFWQRAFAPTTLRQICAIREGLQASARSATRDVLRALMLGALHGPVRKDGTSSYLSNQAPRTYAPKPRYALQFWRDRKLFPPKVSVLSTVEARARRALQWSDCRGVAGVGQADSRTLDWTRIIRDLGRIRWIVTSPPYYGLKTYRPDQWLREWFLGGPPEVVYDADEQVGHSSPEAFARDLGIVWGALARVATPDARLVFRFGSINDRKVSARRVARASLRHTPWRIDEIRSAGHSGRGRRQASSFTSDVGPARSEVDVWCSLG